MFGKLLVAGSCN